jgi:hypothetical protein
MDFILPILLHVGPFLLLYKMEISRYFHRSDFFLKAENYWIEIPLAIKRWAETCRHSGIHLVF